MIEPSKRIREGTEPCYKCGIVGHWYNTCRASNAIAATYKRYTESKEKETYYLEETNNGMYRGEIECLVDSGTTHTILRNKLLFGEINDYKSSMTTMIGSSNLIIGRGTANFLLPNGTKMTIKEALYAPKTN
ncbi:hypothetical protein OSB04_012267 [Centaurea solstitialis]|uniref:CCHC-type domain-containing protein n=1 Tax=Centaurea solstitialis TaxID=347529 RepID=A0AA38TB35_9ASTR|nr:hypothetical protein OSB04_012267 [Centaurea solstitialis]